MRKYCPFSCPRAAGWETDFMHASSVRRTSGKKILGHKLRKGTGGMGGGDLDKSCRRRTGGKDGGPGGREGGRGSPPPPPLSLLRSGKGGNGARTPT